MMEIVVTDIVSCARCDKDHPRMEFRKFRYEGPEGNVWTHWAMCPKLMEPILLRLAHEN